MGVIECLKPAGLGPTISIWEHRRVPSKTSTQNASQKRRGFVEYEPTKEPIHQRTVSLIGITFMKLDRDKLRPPSLKTTDNEDHL